MSDLKRIAVIGGTGDLGKGLAARMARSCDVIIGSRDPAKAKKTAEELCTLTGSQVIGLSNPEAAAECEAAILAIPDLPDREMLLTLSSGLRGKLVISPIVPMTFEKGVFRYTLREGSAAEKVAAVLGPRTVAAFHNVPADKLMMLEHELDYDVLVASEDRKDFEETAGLITAVKSLRPLYCGGLHNARSIESLTPLLLNVARQNKMKSPSLKVV